MKLSKIVLSVCLLAFPVFSCFLAIPSYAEVSLTGSITANIYVQPDGWGGEARFRPQGAPLFTQTFMQLIFNPPSDSGINCGGVNEKTQPFTNVVPGTCALTPVAGNGYEAWNGSLFPSFATVFTGTIYVSQPGTNKFNFYSDDGWILSIGPEINNPTLQPINDGAPMINAPAGGYEHSSYTVVGSLNQASSPTRQDLGVYFPAAGVYPFELDYFEVQNNNATFVLFSDNRPIPTAAPTPSSTPVPSATPVPPPTPTPVPIRTNWNCLVEGDVATLQCIGIVMQNIIDFLIPFSGVIAVIFLIWAGIKYITAGGDKEKIESAKNTIMYALIGILIVAFAFAFVRLIAYFTGVSGLSR